MPGGKRGPDAAAVAASGTERRSATLSGPQARDRGGWCIARPQVQRDEDAIGQIERPQTAPLETAETVQRRADRAAVRDDEGGDRLQFGKGARYACDERRPAFAARRRVGVGVAPETDRKSTRLNPSH